MTINASVKSTEFGLHNLPAEAIDRAIDRFDYLPDGCWQSHYVVARPGGPQIQWTIEGTVYYMYHWRVVYFLQNARIPAQYSLVRSCDNTRCVNPEHRLERGEK